MSPRSHMYPSSPLSRAADTLSRTDSSKDARFWSQNTARELALTRGSRTLSMPFPIRYLSRAGLTCNIFRNARSDHPSVTLALIPSAPSRKRTARAERPRR